MGRQVLEIIEEYPFCVIGICSTIADYRLCWHVNVAMGISLSRSESISVYRKGKEPSDFGQYMCVDESIQVVYRLINNKSGGDLLLPEVSEADYLFMADHSPVVDPKGLVAKLRDLKPVLMAFEVPLENLKAKQNLLLTT